MRTAFVGLSGPVLFDYRNPASRLPQDLMSSPNPILESAFGLMLFYDRICFLTRSLCPENMRDLQYVEFLDETDRLPSLELVSREKIEAALRASPDVISKVQRSWDGLRSKITDFSTILANTDDYRLDNHTHGIVIGGLQTRASSMDPACLLFDLEVLRLLDDPNFELIVNSQCDSWLTLPENPLLKATLAEKLIIGSIPNYLNRQGPYHPVIDEGRDSPHIRQFREFLADSTVRSQRDVNEMTKAVDFALKDWMERIVLKHCDDKRLYLSDGKVVVRGAISALGGGPVSSVWSLTEKLYEILNRDRTDRWMAFVVQERRSARLARIGSG